MPMFPSTVLHESMIHPVHRIESSVAVDRLGAEGIESGDKGCVGEERPRKKAKTAQNLVIRPADYVLAAFKANGVCIEEARSRVALKFKPPTEEMIASYKSEILNAVRRNDFEQVKQLHREGRLINCCNKFGDSLLHLACRRSHTEIAKFLVEEVEVGTYIRDDYHRTPLHDAAWTSEPNFELVDLLMSRAPELLLMEDVRGYTPFDYVQRQHWGKWLRFLWERKDLLSVSSAGKI